MRNVLVIFHSRTGTSRRVAQLLAAAQGWPTGEIVEACPRPGRAGTWSCVLDSLLRRHPEVRYVGPEPRGFDAVVLVSPIWVGRLCGPMRSFVASNASHLSSYAVVSTMASSSSGNAQAELARLTGRSPLLCASILAKQVADGSCEPALRALGDTLSGKEGERPPHPVELSPRTV